MSERTTRRTLRRLGWRGKRPKYVLGRPDPQYAEKKGRSWNYTSMLNIVFLVVAALFVGQFLRTGGPAMLRMRRKSEGDMEQDRAAMGHAHSAHDMTHGTH